MLSRVVAFFMLLFLTPVFLILGFLIVLNDGFPFFFTQKRIKNKNNFFKIYKFRTMKKSTPNIATHLLVNPEQYILKSGVFLRKLSLDELPNLINILKGDMVFVGPRPALYNQNELMRLRFDAGVSHLRLGLTGWAQINGRDEISLEKKVALEKEYLQKKSLLFDAKIIFKTFTLAFLKKEGVSH